jgi:glycyl-tRNA synthetase beta chain
MPDPDHEGQPEVLPAARRAGKLTNKFLVVSNISPADPSAVIGGNERVVRPRLADAKFFFDQDRKKLAGIARRRPGQGRLSQQAGHPGRARRSAFGAIAAPSVNSLGGADALARRIARRCWPRPTC